MALTVPGLGTATGVADQAILTLDVAVRAPTATRALDDLAAAVRAVVAAVDDGAADGWSTSGLSLGSDHDREGRVRGHRASQQLTVDAAVESVGAVVGAVVAAGGDAVAVRGLAQRARDHQELASRARAAAMADARDRADQLATLAGRALGDLQEVVEGGPASPAPRPMALRAAAAEMPVGAADDEVVVAVTATWALA